MKYILLASLMIVCCTAGFAQQDSESATSLELRSKLDELASLHEGLKVSHTPDPVYTTLYSPNLSGVQWKHNTTVSSVAGPVKIIEYGYFVQRNGQWEMPYDGEDLRFYTSSDFADKYGCPNSELKPGESYTNSENRSVIDCVPEQRVKWYFIGLDAQNNRIKGEATVKLLAARAPDMQGPQY